jgi:RNA polymerase sigma-70 factor, ECF subfamily
MPNGRAESTQEGADDRAVFTRAVHAIGPDVRRLCAVITLDADMAADAEQSAWDKAWRKRHLLRDQDRFRDWIVRIAANEAKQALRSVRRRRTVPLELAPDVALVADPHAGVELRELLRRLAPADRELLAYRYVLELSSAQIGGLLGLSAEGVRTRLKRLRDRLQREHSTDA